MNPQLMSALRWGLTTFGSFLVTNGTVSASTWQQISGVIIAAAPFIWGLLAHTQAATALAAAAIPGVQVAATRAAPASVQKLANDPNVADVVPVAVPLPSGSPPKDPYETTRRSS